MGLTYENKDGLKDGTGFVPSPVRITEEGSKKRKDVDCPCPFAHIVGRVSIVLAHYPCQK